MESGIITVFCTDRGTHPRRRLAFTGTAVVRPVVVQNRHNDGVRFRCPTCRRDVQLNGPRWDRLVAGLREAGLSEVDVSWLPDV